MKIFNSFFILCVLQTISVLGSDISVFSGDEDIFWEKFITKKSGKKKYFVNIKSSPDKRRQLYENFLSSKFKGINAQMELKGNEDKKEKNKESRAIYDALNNALNMINSHIDEVGCVEFIYQKYPLKKNDGSVLDLDAHFKITQNNREIELPSRYLYEINRHKKYVKLLHYRSLFLYLKKIIFPNNNREKMDYVLAKSLRSLIFKAKDGAGYFESSITHLLDDVRNSVGKRIVLDKPSLLSERLTPKKLDEEMEAMGKKLRGNALKIFNSLSEMLDKNNCIIQNLIKIEKNILSASNSSLEAIFSKLNSSYKAMETLYLNARVGKIRLVNQLIRFTPDDIPLLFQEQKPTYNLSESDITRPEENIINETDSIEEEIFNYSIDEFFKEEHERHQKRKSLLLKSENQNKITEFEEYENFLKEILSGYILNKTIKMNQKKFKEYLKEIGFLLEQNKSGNGSAYYIRPEENNMLFGKGSDYETAFFCVHMPHKQSRVIPYNTYRYIKSGFSNVFGVSLE